MINRNINLNEPFLLKPASIEKLWGGNKLKNNYSKTSLVENLAESWECSTHPDGLSYVDSGMFKGMTLKEVIEKHPEFLGSHLFGEKDLPIIIKFIDADKNLSIQVHPDDDYARRYENGCLGKHEMWYVLEANPNSELIYGLQHSLTRNELRKKLQEGSIENYLQKVKVCSGDVIFVKPGTIHAIGKGILLVEIQQNSNITYRMYDYNRIDKNGFKRQLHIEKALDVINYKPGLEVRQPMRVIKYVSGVASEFLCRCKYFQVERLLINNENNKNPFYYETKNTSFETLLCIKGSGWVQLNFNNRICYKKGDCLFIPANSKRMNIFGNAELIKVFC